MGGFSRTAKPRYQYTEKKYDGISEWGDREQTAFDELGTKLTTSSVLIYFDPRAPKNSKETRQNMSVQESYHNNAIMGNDKQWATGQKQGEMLNATTTSTKRNS